MADFESFLDDLAEIGAWAVREELPADIQKQAGYLSAPFLPADGWQPLASKLVKLDDAILLMHLFNAYVMHKSICFSIEQTITGVLQLCESLVTTHARNILAAKAAKRFLDAELSKRILAAFNIFSTWVTQLVRTADAVEQQRQMQLHIRRQGRATRQDLLEAYVMFGKAYRKRETRTVSTRR